MSGQEFEPGTPILRLTSIALTYDAMGNLTRVVETDVSGKTRTSVLTYDVVGNLVSVVQT